MCHKKKLPHLSSQAGFGLIETIVVVGIVTLLLGTLLAATLLVARPLSDARATADLASVAQNVITDIRAISAYDIDTIGSVAGTSKRFTLQEPSPEGTPTPFNVSVTYGAQAQAGDPVPVDVTVRNPAGKSISVHQVLVTEAPAPGAVMTPNPSRNAALPLPAGRFRDY